MAKRHLTNKALEPHYRIWASRKPCELGRARRGLSPSNEEAEAGQETRFGRGLDLGLLTHGAH